MTIPITVTPRQVQVLPRILNFYCKNMSPALLTVKTHKYLRENPLDKFFPKNITGSPLPRFCIKSFLREMMFVTSSLRDEDHPVPVATLKKPSLVPQKQDGACAVAAARSSVLTISCF